MRTTTLVLILMLGRNYNREDKVEDSGTQHEVTLVDILTVTYCPKSDQRVSSFHQDIVSILCLNSSNWDSVLFILDSLPTTYLKLWSPSEDQFCGPLVGSLSLKCSWLKSASLMTGLPALHETEYHHPCVVLYHLTLTYENRQCLVFLLLLPN